MTMNTRPQLHYNHISHSRPPSFYGTPAAYLCRIGTCWCRFHSCSGTSKQRKKQNSAEHDNTVYMHKIVHRRHLWWRWDHIILKTISTSLDDMYILNQGTKQMQEKNRYKRERTKQERIRDFFNNDFIKRILTNKKGANAREDNTHQKRICLEERTT